MLTAASVFQVSQRTHSSTCCRWKLCRPIELQAMSKKEIRKRVLSWELPTAWVALVVAALYASPARDLDGLEVFAGAKHLTAGCRSHGLLFETIELEE